MALSGIYTSEDLTKGAIALLGARREGAEWHELTLVEQANLEMDVELVLEALGAKAGGD